MHLNQNPTLHPHRVLTSCFAMVGWDLTCSWLWEPQTRSLPVAPVVRVMAEYAMT